VSRADKAPTAGFRLLPSHRDPEAFHVEKDEIVRELLRAASKLDPKHGVSVSRVARIKSRVTVVDGRNVTVQQRRLDFAV
jgi:hypothetical protein